MFLYYLDAGIAVTPWSPLAMRELTGENRNTVRSNILVSTRNFIPTGKQETNDQIIDRCIEIAEKKDATAAQVELAYCYFKHYMTFPIIGCSKIENLYDLMGAMHLELTEEEIKYLEEPYVPINSMPTKF